MIGASMLAPELQAFQAEVHAEVKRLVTPGLLFALDRNEIPYPLHFIRASIRSSGSSAICAPPGSPAAAPR